GRGGATDVDPADDRPARPAVRSGRPRPVASLSPERGHPRGERSLGRGRRQRLRRPECAPRARNFRRHAPGIRARSEVRLAPVQRCLCRMARCGAPAGSAILREGEDRVSRHSSTPRKEKLMSGKPVHIEIAAKDTGRAQGFYNGLLGWQFESMEGPQEYHMTRFSEDTGGGLFPGDPGAIRVYFDVDDIKSGAARVNELGGKADDPQPIPGM